MDRNQQVSTTVSPLSRPLEQRLNKKLCNYYAFAEVVGCLHQQADMHDCANIYQNIYKKCLDNQRKSKIRR